MTILLPMADPVLLDPFAALEERNRHLANVVEAISRRRDVRRFRAQILLLLLDLACPPGGRPRRAWYVPGAVARVGAEGLRRLWSAKFQEEPRSMRSFRTHLGALEESCALVRAPGDWLPMLRDPQHPERRPRYSDTLHVLESEEASVWWGQEGRQVLEDRPDVRHNPDRWRELLGSWRDRAKPRRPHLPNLVEGNRNPSAGTGTFTVGAALQELGLAPAVPERQEPPLEDAYPTRRKAALELSRVLEPAGNPFDVLDALALAGAHLKGRPASELVANPFRLRASAALYAVALRRGDRIRKPAGWVVRAWKFAKADEVLQALTLCARLGRWSLESDPTLNPDPEPTPCSDSAPPPSGPPTPAAPSPSCRPLSCSSPWS